MQQINTLIRQRVSALSSVLSRKETQNYASICLVCFINLAYEKMVVAEINLIESS
jgi:hypothetical protein